jgi:hypothetical protein
MYLIPPMDEEPPPAYVRFVSAHLGELRRETNRLVGGDADGAHLYMDVLADVAGHWRRLCLLARLGRRDAPADYLRRRMTSRTQHWRDEQVYEVDVRVLHATPMFTPAGPVASLALRKAAVLPGNARSGVVALADAEIAWVQAYRRQQWHRIGRVVVAFVLVIGGFIQYVSWLSTPS